MLLCPSRKDLGHAFAHCPKFPTAATIRFADLVSVPLWPILLSDWLRIIGLVSLYLTNNLILRKLI